MNTTDSFWHTAATASVPYRNWSEPQIIINRPLERIDLGLKAKEDIPIKEPEKKEFLFDPKELDI